MTSGITEQDIIAMHREIHVGGLQRLLGEMREQYGADAIVIRIRQASTTAYKPSYRYPDCGE